MNATPTNGRRKRAVANNRLDRNCLTCNAELRGRTDKKFCDDYCRSSYNNYRSIPAKPIIRTINAVLRKNRRILEELLDHQPHVRVQKADLVEKGFDFRYLTYFSREATGSCTFGCYEYRYRIMNEVCEIDILDR